MEVKAGYKLTEVGVIPEDWEPTSLATISSFITKGSTPTTYGFKWKTSGVLFLRSECVSEQGLDLTQSMFISEEAHATFHRSQVKPDDLLITITGNVGRVVVFEGVDRANLNQHIARVRISASHADPRFVYFWLSQASVRHYFSSITTGQAYPQISLQQVRSAEVPLPPLPEQQAIAATLSDVDALLSGLDRLIAKKRELRLATMQQLLTGRTRLPGFHEEWGVKRLAEICTMKSGEGITSANIRDFSAYPCYGGNGLRGYTTRFTHDGCFALIGRQGALCGNVVRVEGRFFASEHAVVVTPSSGTDIRWLTYVLASMALNQYSESSAQPGLSVSRIMLLDVFAPPSTAEQAAIAIVLSDIDAELAALKARRDKTRALKQAMMQELLTGRTRLV
jgi:type I restriction enzyme, S subunit